MLHHRRNVTDPFRITQNVSLVRRTVHKIQKKYSWLLVIGLLVACTLELLSLMVYIYAEEYIVEWTDNTSITNYPQGKPVFFLQSALSIFFALEWLLLIVSDEYKLAYFFSFPTLINFLTCFPHIVCFIGALFNEDWTKSWVPMYLRVWWLHDHLLQLLDYPQANFISDLARDMLRNILSLLSTMMTCVGTFQAVESFTVGNIHIFECCYFIVVTFGTIGYGDFAPKSVESRLVTIVIIVVAVYRFPLFFSRLAEIAKQRPRFTSFSSKKGALQHVVVVGSLLDRDVFFFLNEFFSGARRFIKLKIVLLSDIEFSQETRLLVSSPVYHQRVSLVLGDPSKRADLERCDAAFADALFLVSNDNLSSSFADYETVMKSMAIHQFDANLPQHVMLKRERNSKFVAPFVSSIMEKERLKFTLLGLGAVLPGTIPLIVNLVRTYDPDDALEACRTWKEQNEWGMGNEIYTFDPPESFIGINFHIVVSEYAKYDITPIGIADLVDDNNTIKLNPKAQVVKRGNKIIAIAADKIRIDDASDALRRKNFSNASAANITGILEEPNHKAFSFVNEIGNSLDRQAYVTIPAKSAEKELADTTGHVILVDLASAQSSPAMSQEAEEEAEHFRAMDMFNIIRPIKQQGGDTRIVLLTRYDISEHFAKMWRETGCDPIIVVKGCGLNVNELRACNPCHARAIVVFSTGEGNDANADAMSMLVNFSCNELMKGVSRAIPVVCEVDRIESLSLFPPYYTEDSMSAVAEGNFAFEPNFIIGSSICTSMLDPALYQTYFNPQLLRIVDTMIYGAGKSAPISSMAVPENCATYGEVISECLRQGFIPVGLHRQIEDKENEELKGKRFMFTNPPSSTRILGSDVVYFLA